MSRRHLPLPLIAALAAGTSCADAPTAAAPAAASPNAVFFALGYKTSPLPFLPVGINDSGVVVGTVRDSGALTSSVARYYNGVLTRAVPLPGVSGRYQATAIQNSGAMAGFVAGGPGLYWRAFHQVPFVIPAPTYGTDVYPTAINNNTTVPMAVGVFNYHGGTINVTQHAFRWTPLGGLVDITPAGYVVAYAVDVNDAGYAVGYGWKPDLVPTALRWNRNNTVVELQRNAKALIVGGDGAALGWAAVDSGKATRYWTLFGGSGTLPTPPNSNVDDMSPNGRIVGSSHDQASDRWSAWTVFNGTTTWLPVPDDSLGGSVFNLSVNACGSIVATRSYPNYDPPSRGFLFTRFGCDLSGISTGGGTVGGTTGTLAP